MTKLLTKATTKKVKRIRFSPRNVRATQELGTGFRRAVFPSVTIPGNTIQRIAMDAGTGRVAISGGWSVSSLVSAYATDSYPSSDQVWVLYIDNPNPNPIIVTPYLISKSRVITITRTRK